MKPGTAASLLVGIGAGLASAALIAALVAGTGFALPLFLLSPLPVAIAGLGWGAAASGAAVVATGLSIGLALMPLLGVVAALLIAAPAAWVAYLAGLSRDGPNGREWYPLGRLLLQAAAVVAVALIASGVLLGYDPELLIDEAISAMQAWLGATEGAAPARDQIEPMVRSNVALLPYSTAALLLTMLTVNIWLGARITAMSGRFQRTPQPLWSVDLPTWAAGVFLVALLASLTPGPAGYAAGAVAGASGFALALVGLAVVHAVTLGRPARLAILIAVYGLLLFGISLILLVVIGLADCFLRFRSRLVGPGKP